MMHSASGSVEISSSINICMSVSIMCFMITIAVSHRSIISSVRIGIYYTICVIRNYIVYMPGSVYIMSVIEVYISSIMCEISVRIVVIVHSTYLNQSSVIVSDSNITGSYNT